MEGQQLDGGSASVEAATISYELASDEHEAEVARLMEQFILDEPMMNSLSLDADAARPAVRSWVRALMRAGLTVVAVDRAGGGCRLAGFNTNFVSRRGQPDDPTVWFRHWFPRADVCLNEQFVLEIEAEFDAFAEYGVDTVFVFGQLLVARDYRRRGIGGGLVARSLELARERGVGVALTTGSSAYSQSIFEAHGFRRVVQRGFDRHPNAEKFSKENVDTHKFASVYVLQL